MKEESKSGDRWEEALDSKHEELRRCQREHGLSSCLSCQELLACSIRKAYVNAVYESMNKGRGGGFEF